MPLCYVLSLAKSPASPVSSHFPPLPSNTYSPHVRDSLAGKKAKEFSTVSVSGGKKAGFQKGASRPAG
jgi:hypothetical protein